MSTRRPTAGPPISPERSALMGRVRQKGTGPELAVRRCLHGLGYRFRLHRNDLPGTPDIVLPKYRKAIFVHGCFWHRHRGCKKTTTPKTRVAFWEDKFRANVRRDRNNIRALRRAGWEPIVVWGCETADLQRLKHRLKEAVERDPGILN